MSVDNFSNGRIVQLDCPDKKATRIHLQVLIVVSLGVALCMAINLFVLRYLVA